MRNQVGKVAFNSQFKTVKDKGSRAKDRSSDDTVTVVATSTILVRGGVSWASVLEDDAVAVVASATVLVGGNVGGRENNAVEGIHVCCFV